VNPPSRRTDSKSDSHSYSSPSRTQSNTNILNGLISEHTINEEVILENQMLESPESSIENELENSSSDLHTAVIEL
jgi:hypothetical protein